MNLATAVLAAAMARAVPAWAGSASWYGDAFHGRLTASGEVYDQHSATCAHRTADFGSILEITDLDTGRRVTCRVNDRGPYTRGRVVDLSRATAKRLGIISRGVARVRVRVVR